MPNFANKRLQVFVSSTYQDLKEERQAVVSAILTAEHIPAGMELFTAGDEGQMEVIRQWIEECDVFFLLLGTRYGSLEPKTEKSYTHLEYEHALKIGKPWFACVFDEGHLNARIEAHPDRADIVEKDSPDKLRAFRDEITNGPMVRFWRDSKDITITIHESIPKIARRDGLVGWIRGDNQADTAKLADELARLSHENALLRERETEGERFNGLSFEEMEALLVRKGLLEVFVESSVSGQFRSKKTSKTELDMLVGIGLVTSEWRIQQTTFSRRVDNTKSYFLSETGIAFANRLRLERDDPSEEDA